MMESEYGDNALVPVSQPNPTDFDVKRLSAQPVAWRYQAKSTPPLFYEERIGPISFATETALYEVPPSLQKMEAEILRLRTALKAVVECGKVLAAEIHTQKLQKALDEADKVLRS